MVVFDTSTIVLTMDQSARAPIDPTTSQPVTKCKERVEYLIKSLSESKTRILLPTPVLSEFLVKAGKNKEKYLNEFLQARSFFIGVFDERAAIELAYLEDPDLKSAKVLGDVETKAKVRFDRQIIAISKVQGADCIYTSDGNLASQARLNGIRAVMTWEILLPPEPPQANLFTNPEAGSW